MNRARNINMICVYALCETMPMGDMGNRLKAARAAAGYPSARAAATKKGWKVSTYAAHENGQNDFKPEDAIKYAKAFKTSPGYLLTGVPVPNLGVPTGRGQVAVVEMEMEPVEALKRIRALLRVAAESDDVNAIQKYIAMAEEIIIKALPKPRGLRSN
jgi:transcriptional regulator with XRE-family HTH domain